MRVRVHWDLDRRKKQTPSKKAVPSPSEGRPLTLSMTATTVQDKEFIHNLYTQLLEYMSTGSDLPIKPIPFQESK